MSKSNTLETGLLNLIFANQDFAGVGDVGGLRGSAAAGSLYLALHSADPGEAGTQATNEVTYTSYARVAVTRGAAWTVAGNQVTNANAITFPTGTGGSGTATHFSVGTASSGAGTLLYKGALASALTLGSGIAPAFAAGQIVISED